MCVCVKERVSVCLRMTDHENKDTRLVSLSKDMIRPLTATHDP